MAHNHHHHQDHVESFLSSGHCIVHDILSAPEINQLRVDLAASLVQSASHASPPFDPTDLPSTASSLSCLSSTNGAGAVLDVFYQPFQLSLLSNPKVLSTYLSLLHGTFAAKPPNPLFPMPRPYTSTSSRNVFMYCDRVGYRLPDALNINTATATATGSKKKRKIQRSLTPHLDCCPQTFHGEKESKWRPIQGLVALTDTLVKNEGGFECIPGFHKEFDSWVENRGVNVNVNAVDADSGGDLNLNLNQSIDPSEAPCVGEFTPLRPGSLTANNNDQALLNRMQHIPLKAGDFLLWDNRLPHANAFRNDSPNVREVVYVSYLPDVEVNRAYASEQRERFLNNQPPNDMWVDGGGGEGVRGAEKLENLSPLCKQLMHLDDGK